MSRPKRNSPHPRNAPLRLDIEDSDEPVERLREEEYLVMTRARPLAIYSQPGLTVGNLISLLMDGKVYQLGESEPFDDIAIWHQGRIVGVIEYLTPIPKARWSIFGTDAVETAEWENSRIVPIEA